ncbi:MAG: hypothetical protein ACR2IK_16070 [Chloroflexota bacterium]
MHSTEGSPPPGDGLPTTDEPEPAHVDQPETVAPGPRRVRRIVCSYRLGWLPGDWLRTWRRLERVLAEAGLEVQATLAPLEDLPADTDILVVPPDLREAARAAALPNTRILVTPATAAAGAFADLVSRLEAGAEFSAERVAARVLEEARPGGSV